MTMNGHLVLAAVPAVVYAHETGLPLEWKSLLYAAVIAFFALLPDIDEPNSYLGRRLRRLSGVILVLGIEHRTLTHWLILPFLATVSAALLLDPADALWIYLAAYGMVMHSVGDLLTSSGIRGFFWPLMPDRTIHLLPQFLTFKTGSWQETMVIWLLLGAAFYVIYGDTGTVRYVWDAMLSLFERFKEY